MNNNLPMKEENSLLEKVKRFFRNLFYKQETNEINSSEAKKLEVRKEDEKERFDNTLKVEVKNEYLKDAERTEFLEKLEKDPKLFYELSLEKLEKLEQYYEQSLKEQEDKLAKIKKAS